MCFAVGQPNVRDINIDPPLKIYHCFCFHKASRAASRMLTGLNGKSISFCTDKQGPICYQLSICVVDPQMTYFVFQTQFNQADRRKADPSRRGKARRCKKVSLCWDVRNDAERTLLSVWSCPSWSPSGYGVFPVVDTLRLRQCEYCL